MAIGDQYRRISPADQLVFDSTSALVGIKSGLSTGPEARVPSAAQAAALAGAPLTQTGSTVAVLNASKTALRDPAGGADIALGGSGNPGGSNTQVQYNNAGAFSGIAGFQFNVASNSFSVGDGTNVFTFAFNKNNDILFKQRNGANNGFLNLPYYNYTDQLVLGGQIFSSSISPGVDLIGHQFIFTGAAGARSTLLTIQQQTVSSGTQYSFLVYHNTDIAIGIFQNLKANSTQKQQIRSPAGTGSQSIEWSDTSGNGWSAGRTPGGDFVIAPYDVSQVPTMMVVGLTDRNVSWWGNGSFGAGSRVMFLSNCTTAPTTNPTGGAIVYVEGGALKIRSSVGVVSEIGKVQMPAPVAVSALPAAASNAWDRRSVNNSTMTHTLGVGAIVVDGGASGNSVPVYSDGTNWRIG